MPQITKCHHVLFMHLFSNGPQYSPDLYVVELKLTNCFKFSVYIKYITIALSFVYISDFVTASRPPFSYERFNDPPSKADFDRGFLHDNLDSEKASPLVFPGDHRCDAAFVQISVIKFILQLLYPMANCTNEDRVYNNDTRCMRKISATNKVTH